MDARDKLIRLINGPSAPFPVDKLSYYWARKNVTAIAAIAMRSMLDNAGTVYDLPPLRIVGFQNDDARIQYQLKLHESAEVQHNKHIVEYAINRHVEELVEFCRVQFIIALSGAPATSLIFQIDKFAHFNTLPYDSTTEAR